jgi:hypothetical protein
VSVLKTGRSREWGKEETRREAGGEKGGEGSSRCRSKWKVVFYVYNGGEAMDTYLIFQYI